jgi:hypothetical protein
MFKNSEGSFSRRGILRTIGGIAVMGISFLTAGCFKGKTLAKKQDWPSQSDWDQLREQVGGRLSTVDSPLKDAIARPGSAAAAALILAIPAFRSQ